jgi:hypothetical protein
MNYETNLQREAQAFVSMQAALVAIVAEVTDYPPFKSTSHLPDCLIEQARAALTAAGFDVSTLQPAGGAQ